MSSRTHNERVIGLDPGIARTGYAVVERRGGDLRALAFGCIETAARLSAQDRLLAIERTMEDLLDRFAPVAAALEKLFVAANARTAVAVGQARGVLLLSLARRGIAAQEFSPQEVKLSATGYGRAEKGQVQRMMQRLFRLDALPKPDDAADALALAAAACSALRRP